MTGQGAGPQEANLPAGAPHGASPMPTIHAHPAASTGRSVASPELHSSAEGQATGDHGQGPRARTATHPSRTQDEEASGVVSEHHPGTSQGAAGHHADEDLQPKGVHWGRLREAGAPEERKLMGMEGRHADPAHCRPQGDGWPVECAQPASLPAPRGKHRPSWDPVARADTQRVVTSRRAGGQAPCCLTCAPGLGSDGSHKQRLQSPQVRAPRAVSAPEERHASYPRARACLRPLMMWPSCAGAGGQPHKAGSPRCCWPPTP